MVNYRFPLLVSAIISVFILLLRLRPENDSFFLVIITTLFSFECVRMLAHISLAQCVDTYIKNHPHTILVEFDRVNTAREWWRVRGLCVAYLVFAGRMNSFEIALVVVLICMSVYAFIPSPSYELLVKSLVNSKMMLLSERLFAFSLEYPGKLLKSSQILTEDIVRLIFKNMYIVEVETQKSVIHMVLKNSHNQVVGELWEDTNSDTIVFQINTDAPGQDKFVLHSIKSILEAN